MFQKITEQFSQRGGCISEMFMLVMNQVIIILLNKMCVRACVKRTCQCAFVACLFREQTTTRPVVATFQSHIFIHFFFFAGILGGIRPLRNGGGKGWVEPPTFISCSGKQSPRFLLKLIPCVMLLGSPKSTIGTEAPRRWSKLFLESMPPPTMVLEQPGM